MMQYFLDISLIAIVLVTVLVYWHRGLIRSLMGAAKTVMAIILTYCFGDAARDWLYSYQIQPAVRDFVHQRLEQLAGEGRETYDLSSVLDTVPSWMQSLLQLFHVDIEALETKYAAVTDGSYAQLEEFCVSVSDPVVSFVSAALGYAGVFLVALLLMSVLAFLLGKLADLPVIRTCDRALGLILGLLCAVLFSSLYVLLLYTLLGWWEVTHPQILFSEGFDKTWLFQYAYQFNLFRFLFGI
jgi:uncharacterized membrane protein required for colicin V production